MEEQAFLAQASHDIKSLLTSVKAYAQLLQRQLSKTNDDKAMLYAEKIDGQINKVTKMMSDLVDVYRIKAGKLELYKEKLDIDQFIADIIEQMQTTTTTHTLTIKGKTGISVAFDKMRMSQALGNVVHNAIIYSPKNTKILIRIQQAADGVLVLVEDEGKGIPKEKIPSLFDPFLHERSHGMPGLGAGVFIASSIVKAHGGELTIEGSAFVEKTSTGKEVGKGTRVKITLPIS